MADPPRPRTWRRTALRWAVFLAALWVGVGVVMKWLENSLVYHPDRAELPRTDLEFLQRRPLPQEKSGSVPYF